MKRRKNRQNYDDDFAKEFDEIFGFSSEDLNKVKVPTKRESETHNSENNKKSKSTFVYQSKDKNFKNNSFSKYVSKVNNITIAIYIFIFVIIIAILIFNKQNTSKKPIGRFNENISETTLESEKEIKSSSDESDYTTINDSEMKRLLKEKQIPMIGEKKVFPLDGILSNPSKEASKIDNFYVTQDGTKFIFSNGYELTVNGYKEMNLISEPVVVGPKTNYSETKLFLSYEIDNKDFEKESIYVRGFISNDIFKTYYIENYSNEGKIYKVSDAKKYEGYEVVYVYIKNLSMNTGSKFNIDIIYCFDDGCGIIVNLRYFNYEYLYNNNEKIIDTNKLDEIKERLNNSIQLTKVKLGN